MATIDAPYPSEMDEIHGQSVVSMLRPPPGTTAIFRNRASEIVASMLIRNDPTKFVKAVRRLASFDTDARDVLVKDWYRPFAPNIKLANPATLPTGASTAVSWSLDGRYVAVGHSTTPFLTIYKRSGDTFTKLANPTNPPAAQVVSLAWAPDGKYLITCTTAMVFQLYQRIGDTFSQSSFQTSLLSTMPTSYANKIRWSRDGMYLAMATLNTPYHILYKRNTPSSNMFNKLPDKSELTTTNVGDFAWSQDCTYLVAGSWAYPNLYVFKRSGDTFTRLTLPTVPNGICRGLAFSVDDNFLACAINVSPYVNVYSRSGDTFTKLANPTTAAGGLANAVDWTPDGGYLSVAHQGAPYLTVYKFDSNKMPLTKIADAATAIPASSADDVRFSPDGIHLAVSHNATPFITLYKSAMGPVSGPAVRIDPNAPVLTGGGGGISPV